jgi:hypothetical protein
LNAVDPELESAWFQHLSPQSEKTGFKICAFKLNVLLNRLQNGTDDTFILPHHSEILHEVGGGSCCTAVCAPVCTALCTAVDFNAELDPEQLKSACMHGFNP